MLFSKIDAVALAPEPGESFTKVCILRTRFFTLWAPHPGFAVQSQFRHDTRPEPTLFRTNRPQLAPTNWQRWVVSVCIRAFLYRRLRLLEIARSQLFIDNGRDAALARTSPTDGLSRTRRRQPLFSIARSPYRWSASNAQSRSSGL